VIAPPFSRHFETDRNGLPSSRVSDCNKTDTSARRKSTTHEGEGGVDAQRAESRQSDDRIHQSHPCHGHGEFIAFTQEHGITLEQAAAPPDRFRCTQRGRNSQLRCQNRTPCANEGMTRSPGARIQYLAVSYGGLFSGKESETAVGLKRRPLASGCEIGNIRCENLDRQANCNACGRQPVSLMSRLRSHWKNSHAHGLTVM
jgi:hypothetical protein